MTATGSSTLLGRIAEQVQGVSSAKTPLHARMEQFAHRLGLFALAFCAALFVTGLFLEFRVAELFMMAIAMAVAIIPEGLPVVVTITMAIGVQRMARRKAIVRKLPAVETLGSATVICSDKTGTLTRNEMTVRRIFDGGNDLEVTGVIYLPALEWIVDTEPLSPHEILDMLAMAASVIVVVEIDKLLTRRAQARNRQAAA